MFKEFLHVKDQMRRDVLAQEILVGEDEEWRRYVQRTRK
jgi:hypothetical protein